MEIKTFFKIQSILNTATSSLEETTENIEGWESVYLDPNEAGASDLVIYFHTLAFPKKYLSSFFLLPDIQGI